MFRLATAFLLTFIAAAFAQTAPPPSTAPASDPRLAKITSTLDNPYVGDWSTPTHALKTYALGHTLQQALLFIAESIAVDDPADKQFYEMMSHARAVRNATENAFAAADLLRATYPDDPDVKQFADAQDKIRKQSTNPEMIAALLKSAHEHLARIDKKFEGAQEKIEGDTATVNRQIAGNKPLTFKKIDGRWLITASSAGLSNLKKESEMAVSFLIRQRIEALYKQFPLDVKAGKFATGKEALQKFQSIPQQAMIMSKEEIDAILQRRKGEVQKDK